MKNGWKLPGDEKGIKTTKNRKDLIFDIVVHNSKWDSVLLVSEEYG